MKILLLLICALLAEDQGDYVNPTDMPLDGFVKPFYAGYLKLTDKKSFYYTYFPSEQNPSKDPLVVRVSAGPGCSSIYSAYYSKGPFTFVRDTTEFRVNPFNWNKKANVLFIEGPAGVGYSFGEDTDHGDEELVIDYYISLLRFYEKFPELKHLDVHLTGEQYAGIIVPKLAVAILEAQKAEDVPAWEKINLSGIFLNNPCTLNEECDEHEKYSEFEVEFLHSRYFISDEEHKDFKAACSADRKSEACEKAAEQIRNYFIKTGADPRNVYGECLLQDGNYPCVDHKGIDVFLNTEQFRKDLHA